MYAPVRIAQEFFILTGTYYVYCYHLIHYVAIFICIPNNLVVAASLDGSWYIISPV